MNALRLKTPHAVALVVAVCAVVVPATDASPFAAAALFTEVEERARATARARDVRQSDQDHELDDLARRAQAGDPAAATELCSRCGPLLQRYFRRAFGNSDDAEDASQHVMVQLLGALPRYRHQGTPFRAFVFRLARNHAIDRGAVRGRSTALPVDDLDRLQDSAGESPEPGRGSEQRESLDYLLAPLPEIQQRVIRLIYQHDLTPNQTAAVLGHTPASVRQLHKRARDTLRELVLMQSGGSYPSRRTRGRVSVAAPGHNIATSAYTH